MCRSRAQLISGSIESAKRAVSNKLAPLVSQLGAREAGLCVDLSPLEAELERVTGALAELHEGSQERQRLADQMQAGLRGAPRTISFTSFA